MIISRDLAKDGNVNVLKKRASEFKTEVKLGESKQKQVVGAFVHPKTGRIYYALYPDQVIYEYDLRTRQQRK